MAKIKCIKARQIFDSHDSPMIEADVILDDGTFARAAVPCRSSAGSHEAFGLRCGVSQAAENVNKIIAPALVGMDPTEQAAVDNFMVEQLDGTANEWGWSKQKLGVEAILVVSLAVCKAGAAVKEIPLYKHIANLAGNSRLVLPVPAFNVINGGSHAGNKLAMQEFMILPVGASSFKEAMKMAVEVYDHLKAIIKMKYGQAAIDAHDDASGFIKENEKVLELLKQAIENADYTDKVFIGMKVAASELYGQDRTYDMNFKEENNDGSQKISGDALCNVYESFVSDYAIVSIEGPFDQDDLEHYARITDRIGEHIQIAGGDLLGTNLMRVEKAINEKTCNALLVKVDQIGSVTECIEAIKMSKVAGWGVMASCGNLGQQQSIANILMAKVSCFGQCTKLRSGETEDAFIADLSVGLATGQIKTGAPCRSKWQAKYNRLLQIEKELEAEAVYAGANFRKPVEPY